MVVIGAGLSGLAAAARLARLKHDVVVCERSPGPGGQAGRFERDGFAFDTGPTTLLMPASYRDLFVKTGKTTPIENYLDLQPIEPAVRWRFADGTVVDLPNASRAGTMDAVSAAFGAKAATAWDEFVRCGEGVWDRFRKGFHDGPPVLSGKRFRVPAEEKAALEALNPARSYRELTQRHLGRFPHLEQVAMSWPARLGTDPPFASSGTVLWPWLEQTFGVWAPVGGIRALVDVVVQRALSRGAEFRYATEVTGLHLHGGTVQGVRLADGDMLPADVVVAAVDDRTLGHWLASSPLPLRSEGRSAFTMLLALDGVDEGPSAQLSLSSTVYDWNPTITRAEAPPGCSAYTVSSPEDLHGKLENGAWDWTDQTETERRTASLIQHLDDRGFEVTRRLLWAEIRTPHDLAQTVGSPDGAIGGPALIGREGLVRPPNATGVKGLFHVGAAAHPGPGIAFAPLGAALVADAVGRAR
ncbi:MAG: phytoene desaturase family protein [Sporichthyaceae bacterium]